MVPPQAVQSVRILTADGVLLGETALTARRQDINEKHGLMRSSRVGFDLVVDGALATGTLVTCVLIGDDGAPLVARIKPIALKAGEVPAAGPIPSGPIPSGPGKAAAGGAEPPPKPAAARDKAPDRTPDKTPDKTPASRAKVRARAEPDAPVPQTESAAPTPIPAIPAPEIPIPAIPIPEAPIAGAPPVPEMPVPEMPAAEPVGSLDITEAVFFGRAREILVRGWATVPDGIGTIRIRAGRKTISATALALAPPDQGTPPDTAPDTTPDATSGTTPGRRIGFSVTARLPDTAGQEIEISALGRANKVMASVTRSLDGQADLITDLEVAYDFDSKQLRISGCLFPANHLRQLEVVFARGRAHPIKSIFLHRPGQVARDPRGVTVHSGFFDRIQHVGEGEIRPARLRMLYTDGTAREWEIPAEIITLRQPEAEIEQINIDWLERRYSVSGWYRSHEPITEVQLTLNGRPVFGIPRVTDSARIQKLHAFRGVMASEFVFEGLIDAAFADTSDMFGETLSPALRLRHRDRVVLDLAQAEVASTTRWGYLSYLQFDRRTNILHASGGFAAPATPHLAQLMVNGRPIDRALPLQVSFNGKHGFFSWTHEINAAMAPGSKVALKVFDRAGVALGEIAQKDIDILNVSQGDSVEGHSADQLAKHLVRSALRNRLGDGPSVCMVYQGTVTGTITGGGPQRVLDLMASFRDAGYTTVLIDRTEPWNLLAQGAGYAQLRRICDVHLMVPQQVKRGMINDLAATFAETPGLLPPGFAPLGMPFADALKASLEKRPEAKGLAQRSDVQFNIIAAALANLLKPRVIIGNFAWSAPMMDYVQPAVHRVIDTHDVQALRSTVFRRARETFGEAAVPNLERYDVDLQDELKLLMKADSLIAISADEREFLVKHIAPAKVVLAQMSNRFTAPLPPSPPASLQVMFVGNAYEPNTDGISRFIAEQWPKVIKKQPNARLVICGRVCDGLQGITDPTVELLGVVPDLDAVYQESAITLNPVRFATGASVKLIEALARGRVAVSTAVGAKGFDASARNDGLRVVAFDRFHEVILALLGDPAARRRAETAAADFARARFSPSVAHADMFNFLESKLFY